jgi:hypothetical protein
MKWIIRILLLSVFLVIGWIQPIDGGQCNNGCLLLNNDVFPYVTPFSSTTTTTLVEYEKTGFMQITDGGSCGEGCIIIVRNPFYYNERLDSGTITTTTTTTTSTTTTSTTIPTTTTTLNGGSKLIVINNNLRLLNMTKENETKTFYEELEDFINQHV